MREGATFAECSEQRKQWHSEDGEMVALDAIEQLHSAAFHPEYADTIADLGPFGIQICLYEPVRERPNLKVRCLDVAPIQRSASRKCDGAAQQHGLAGEQAQMFYGVFPVLGLVKSTAVDTDHAVAADHPFPGNTDRLCAGEPKRDLARVQ